MTYRRGSEYQPTIGAGKRFAVVAGLAFTAACQAEIQPTPTTEIFPTQPQATEVVPTPTPEDTIHVGVGMSESEIIREVNGRTPPGGGGLISTADISEIILIDSIHKVLLSNSLAPVHENEVISRVANRPDGSRECYPIMPDHLFNPYLPSAVEPEDSWLSANSIIVSYGDDPTGEVRFKGLRTVSLKQTPEDIFCVSAVVNSDDNPFEDRDGRPVNDGVVLNVLMDTDGNIYGTLPGIYGADDDVTIDFETGNVLVRNTSGTTSVWYIGDKMAGLVAESEEPVANREQIQSNINAFLNGELTFNINDPNETDLFRFDHKERLPLGWHHIYDRDFGTVRYKNVDLHSVFLGGVVKDNNFFYILGTENNREERLVYLSTSGFLDNSNEFPRLTQTFYERVATPYPIFLTSLSGASQRMLSNNELPNFMSDYIGKPIFTLFSYDLETDVEISVLGLLNEAETPFAKKWLDGDPTELIKWLEGTGDKPSFAIENISQLELVGPFKTPLISMLKLPRVDK